MAIKGLSDSALRAEFYMFLGAESADFGTTAGLLSYGFYKSGRIAADNLNDWGTGIATGGLSVGQSAAIYHGLNYLYGNGDLDMLDQFQDDEGAEENIAKAEEKLFSLDSNDPSKNEVSFGGGAKGEIDIADGSFKGEVDAMLSTTINKESLLKSGKKGAQKNVGFFEDYEVGGDKKFALKFASSFKGGAFSGRKSMVMNFGKQPKSRGGSRNGNKEWNFEKLDFEMAYGLSGVAGMDLTQREVLQQFIQLGVGYFNKEKTFAKDKDSKAEIDFMDSGAAGTSIYDQAKNTITQIGGAVAMDGAKAFGSPLDVTDKLEALLKISSGSDGKPELTFQIVRTTTTEVDFKLVKGEVVDYTPIVGYTFKAR